MVDGKVYHLGLSPEQITPNIFVVGDPARAHRVASRFEEINHQVQHREFITITGRYQGHQMTVMGTGIGTDNVEIAIIEAYGLLAFDHHQFLKHPPPQIRIIRIGTSGGIQADIDAGTLAVTNYAIGLDSTALYYDHQTTDDIEQLESLCIKILDQQIPEESRFKGRLPVYASQAHTSVHEALVTAAAGLKAVSGITVTAPGFYGPSGRHIPGLVNTLPQIKSVLATLSYRDLRIVNMEMESSLIYHLGEKLGIKCGTICPIISNPVSHQSIPDYQMLVDQAIDTGLRAMVSLL